ncbi:MAG: hypothetical protein IK084_02575, partial [Bacteroidaceae bacterium]|nr:hypothetical protein [Bacteroidaceae bacterium]
RRTHSLIFPILRVVVERKGNEVGEDVNDDDDNAAHQDPFADFFSEVGFDDRAEADSDDRDDDCGDDGRPENDALNECCFIHSAVI